MNRLIARLAIVSLLVLGAGQLWGQGLLIPDQPVDRFHFPRPHLRPVPTPQVFSYRIKELSIDATLKDQIAVTQVTQTFENTGTQQMEVCFVFPLPYDGAIDRLTFMVDGRELEAKLLPADKAREIYNGYVRRYQDPALLEWVGTGMFKTSIFPVPAGAQRTVSLEFTQLLRKDQQITDYLFPLSTAKYTSKPIENLTFRLAIESQSEIKNVYSPTHAIEVQRDDNLHAVVKFHAKESIPSSDFRLMFDTAKSDIGASVVSYWPVGDDQGYFVLLASPEIPKPAAETANKTILLVIDRSGSMNGKKIEQARDAAKYVINNLNQNDLFNIIAYDSEIESLAPELQRYNEESRSSAVGFINSINAGGSTNINEALMAALKNIQDDSQPAYVVFLTDGLPTVGETNEMRIVENATANNKFKSRIISFGVGFDVNSRLIDRLTRSNHGQSEYVRPNEDIEAAVSRLYQKIAAPVLTDVAVRYDFDDLDVEAGKSVNRVYPSESLDIFAGGQLVLVGRYKKAGLSTITLSGRVGAEKKEYQFKVEFSGQGKNTSNRFAERLWAARRIGEIIDLLDLRGENRELIDELIALSTKHGIMTPYTSFLADENAAPEQLTNKEVQLNFTRGQLQELAAADGQLGFDQRQLKQAFKNAPSAGLAGGGSVGP